MAIAPSRIKAANDMAIRAGNLVEQAHAGGLRTAEEYAAYLNEQGFKRASGCSWTKSNVLIAINRYRKLGGPADLLERSRALTRGWETRRARASAAEAEKFNAVLEDLHRYGVCTSRQYAMALNAKGIKSPKNEPWTEKSAWMLIDRYRKNGGKVGLVKRLDRRIGRTRRVQ